MQHRSELEFPYAPLKPFAVSRRSSIPYLNIFLFLATVLTTTHVGALQFFPDILDAARNLTAGLSFSIPLLVILLAHELGHYIVSKRRGVRVTLPFFIPLPVFSIIGTMGAFIKMESLVPDRRSLFDVGVAGPLAGIAIAIPVSLIGLALSQVVPLPELRGGLQLGDSLLFRGMQQLVLRGDSSHATIMLHPMAFAGWVGLLVTALNLIPAGQLDGGHLAYGLLGRWHKLFSYLMVAGLVLLGFTMWYGWLFWALIITFTLNRLKHPPVLNPGDPIGRGRCWLAALTTLILITTFTPVPFKPF